MKRIAKMLAVCGLFCGVGGLLTGCSHSDSANDAGERKIFSGDASKMPASARQQMEAAMNKGKAGAKMPQSPQQQ